MALLDFSRFGITRQDVKDKKYSYIIGFDLGDGEISAAYWDLTDDGYVQPEDLIFDNGDNKKILSGFFEDDQGKRILGTPTSLSNLIDAKGKLYINFKIPPHRLLNGETFENTDRTNLELMQTLLKESLKMIHGKALSSRFQKTDGTRKKGILVIGCPSSKEWLSDGSDLKYSEMLSNAVKDTPLDLVTIIMPESRASLVKVYKENDIKEKIQNGVIVIDHGSSTLDVTIIDFLNNSNLDFSIPLGAKKIEREMLVHTLKEKGRHISEVLSPIFHRLQFRGAKEAYFTNPLGSPRCSIEYKDGDYYGFKFNRDSMEDILHNHPTSYSTPYDGTVKGSWVNLHKSFIEHCLRQAGPSFNPDNFKGIIMLTGGASKMQFVNENIKKIFPGSKSKEEITGPENATNALKDFSGAVIVTDPEPSYCVSRGLAWAAFTDFKAMGLLEEVNEKIKSLIKADFHKLKEKMAVNIAPIIYDYTLQQMEDWVKNGDGVRNREFIAKIEKSFMDKNTADGRERAEKVRKLIIDSISLYLNDQSATGVRSLIVNKVNEVFSSTFPGKINDSNFTNFEINDAQWASIAEQVSAHQLNLQGSLIDQLDLEAFLVGIFKFALALGILTVALTLSIFTFGLIDFEDITKPFDKFFDDKPMPKPKREKAYRNFKEERSKNIKKIQEGLQKAPTPPEAQENISNQLIETISPIIDKAVNVVSIYF